MNLVATIEKNKYKLQIAAGIALFVSIFFHLLQLSHSIAIHTDEYAVLKKSVVIDALLRADFQDPIWESEWSYNQPKFAEYVYGLVLRFRSGLTVSDFLDQTFYKPLEDKSEESLSWRKQCNLLFQNSVYECHEYFPSQMLPVLYGRQFALLVALLTCAVFFLMIREMGGTKLSFITTTFLIFGYEIFAEQIVQAKRENILYLCTFLAIMFAVKFFKSLITRPTPDSKYFLAFAVLIGLASATKFNGAFVLFSFLFVASALLYTKKVELKQFLLYSLCAGLLSYGVFFMLNPYVWKSPASRTVMFVVHRQNLADQKVHGRDSFPPFPQKYVLIIRNIFSPTGYTRTFSGIDYRSIPLDFFFFVMGCTYIFKLAKNRGDRTNITESGLVLGIGMLIVPAILTFLLIPLDYPRYYIPMSLIVILVQSFGLIKVCDFIAKLFSHT